VEREGAQAAARNTVKRGAIAAAPAPQAALTVSRQPSSFGCGTRRLRRGYYQAKNKNMVGADLLDYLISPSAFIASLTAGRAAIAALSRITQILAQTDGERLIL
jgi:hypothetical protein